MKTIRQVANELLGCVAVIRAWIAYVLYGIEGVNRVMRLAAKPEVIPILRAFGAKIGPDCDIEAPLVLHNAIDRYRNLTIGAGCHRGKEVFIDLSECVTLADRVTLSMRVMILTHIDVGCSPLRESALPVQRQPVTLESGAYVGAGAILMPGIRVGESAAVGAGSVVTRSVSPHTLVVGVPARILRSLRPAGSYP